MKVISKFTVPSNSKAVEKTVLESKPRASKKHAAEKPLSEEVKIETAPAVVSSLLVEEPVETKETLSNDIKEILANSEV